MQENLENFEKKSNPNHKKSLTNLIYSDKKVKNRLRRAKLDNIYFKVNFLTAA